MFNRDKWIAAVLFTGLWTGTVWSWEPPTTAGLPAIEINGLYLAWLKSECEVRIEPGEEAALYEMRLIAEQQWEPGRSVAEILSSSGLVGFDNGPGITRITPEDSRLSFRVDDFVTAPGPIHDSAQPLRGWIAALPGSWNSLRLILSSSEGLPGRIDRIEGALTALFVDEDHIQVVDLALEPTDVPVELIPGDSRLLAQVLVAGQHNGEYRCEVALYLPREEAIGVAPVEAPMVYRFELLDEEGRPLVAPDEFTPRTPVAWREWILLHDRTYAKVIPGWRWSVEDDKAIGRPAAIRLHVAHQLKRELIPFKLTGIDVPSVVDADVSLGHDEIGRIHAALGPVDLEGLRIRWGSFTATASEWFRPAELSDRAEHWFGQAATFPKWSREVELRADVDWDQDQRNSLVVFVNDDTLRALSANNGRDLLGEVAEGAWEVSIPTWRGLMPDVSGDRGEPALRFAAVISNFGVRLEASDTDAAMPRRLTELALAFTAMDYKFDEIKHVDIPLRMMDVHEELMPGLIGRVRHYDQDEGGTYVVELELLVASDGEHGDAPGSVPLPYSVEMVDKAGGPVRGVHFADREATAGWEVIDGETFHLVAVTREWRMPPEGIEPVAAPRVYVAEGLTEERLEIRVTDLPIPSPFSPSH